MRGAALAVVASALAGCAFALKGPKGYTVVGSRSVKEPICAAVICAPITVSNGRLTEDEFAALHR